jgi:hypothetical protein
VGTWTGLAGSMAKEIQTWIKDNEGRSANSHKRSDFQIPKDPKGRKGRAEVISNGVYVTPIESSPSGASQRPDRAVASEAAG